MSNVDPGRATDTELSREILRGVLDAERQQAIEDETETWRLVEQVEDAYNLIKAEIEFKGKIEKISLTEDDEYCNFETGLICEVDNRYRMPYSLLNGNEASFLCDTDAFMRPGTDELVVIAQDTQFEDLRGEVLGYSDSVIILAPTVNDEFSVKCTGLVGQGKRYGNPIYLDTEDEDLVHIDLDYFKDIRDEEGVITDGFSSHSTARLGRDERTVVAGLLNRVIREVMDLDDLIIFTRGKQ